MITLALVTRDQAPYLRVFLANWLRHGAGIPLIVIDDGSSDATPDILAAIPKEAPASVHRITHVTIAHARNQALARAATPWIAFSDTDCLLGADYFAALAALPGRFPGAAAVEGAVRPPDGPPPPFTHGVANLKGGFYATANMVFHVPTVRALGGFDEARFGNYREDTDLALTLLEQKGAIPFYPELIVAHPYVPRRFMKSLSRFWTDQSRILTAEMRLFEKHPATYARVRHRRNARATVLAWCLRHFLSAARRSAPPFGIATLKTLLVAACEQIALLTLCLLRAGKILRLK